MKPGTSTSSPASSSKRKSPQVHKVTYKKRKYTKRAGKGNARWFKKNKGYCRADCYKLEEKKQFKEALIKLMNVENPYVCNEEESVLKFTEKIERNWSPPVSRTTWDIKHFVKYYMKRVYSHRLRNDKPIDKWVDVTDALTPTDNHLEAQITSAILVATEEPIPKLIEPNNPQKKKTKDATMPEPDYIAVYKYLAAAVSQSPLPELSPIDSLLVEDCMQSLAEQVKFLDDGDLRLALRRIFLYLNKTTEDHQPEDAEEETVAQLSKGTIFNPLGLNQNLITPVPPN